VLFGQPSESAPRLVALPQAVPSPKTNPTTDAKVALGERLFFDPRLSGNNEMSCATCHIPTKAFGDGLARAVGARGKELPRNTPTVLNVGFHRSFFWDGRSASLEEQALVPIQAQDEMHQDLASLVRELRAVPEYARDFPRVFGQSVNPQDVARALAAYQRTLISRDSAFDRYLAGDRSALSVDARRGLELFENDADCIRCHHGPLLSDGEFYRLGTSFDDPGRAAVTGDDADLYKFRTPSLRDVAHTGPYMHNGSKQTLTAVVEFYLRGVPRRGPDNLPIDVEPLTHVSYADIDALVAFLESLSGNLPGTDPGSGSP
jgi:cytochrome c peroxidase